MNAFHDTQRRVYNAMRSFRMETGLPMDGHVLVMHPAKWADIRVDAPMAIPFLSADGPRLFGFVVHLDPLVDRDHLALRHEVIA